MKLFQKLPVVKVQECIREYLKDHDHPELMHLIDVVDDKCELKKFTEAPASFRKMMLERELYQSETQFISAFGNDYEVYSFRDVENPFFIPIKLGSSIPFYTGSTICYEVPYLPEELDYYLSIYSFGAPTQFTHIVLNKDTTYGSLGAYWYQIGMILMSLAQYKSLCDKKGRENMTIKGYDELKVIPAFLALYGLYSVVRDKPMVVSANIDSFCDHAEDYKYWARGAIITLLRDVTTNRPVDVLDSIVSLMRGVKLFEIYLGYVESFNKPAQDKILKMISDVLKGEDTVDKILAAYEVDGHVSALLW